MTTPTRETFTTRPIPLTFVLAAAMAVSTVSGTLIGVLAPFLRAEIDLTSHDRHRDWIGRTLTHHG